MVLEGGVISLKMITSLYLKDDVTKDQEDD